MPGEIASPPMSTEVSRSARISGSPGVAQTCTEGPEIRCERQIRWQIPELAQIRSIDPLTTGTRGTELRHGPPGNGDRDPLTSLGAAKDLAHIVAELLLRDDSHMENVAVLLPSVEGTADRAARVERVAEADGIRHELNDALR